MLQLRAKIPGCNDGAGVGGGNLSSPLNSFQGL